MQENHSARGVALRALCAACLCMLLPAISAQAQTSPATGTSSATTTPDALPTPSTPTAKPSLPATRYIPSHDYDVRHLKLDLRFDWEREQARGTATITLAPLVANLHAVELDAGNMTFAGVRLANRTTLKYEADAKAEKLRVELDRAYQPGEELTIAVAYHTNGPVKELGSGNYARGLVFNQTRSGGAGGGRQIYSQGESEFNHLWFPCYDHPNDFASSELIATVERPYTVISNGRLAEVLDNPDGTRSFHWRMDEPHASYLTSIVVGEYAAVEGDYDGIPVTTYVYPQELAEGKLTTARLPDMVRFFSEKTGVRYPYAKYAQTMVRNFPGGMENVSATTMTDNLIHDRRAELDQTSDALEAHELAHQWFGDYVTCREWSDVWLNESFATYFQALWDEHALGRDEFLYADVRGNQDEYLKAWSHGLRRPVVTKNYRDPEAVFDAYAYPRGGAVLHMLRAVLGEENWWRAIHHYLTKYARQPVETAQLRVAIEEATGQSLDWFFDEWVYKMGHPVFRVAQSYDPAKRALTLNVRQEQQVDPNNAYPQTVFFRASVEIEIGTANETRVERVQLAPVAEQNFTFTVEDAPLLVNFDYGRTLIKELIFDKTTNELAYQLARDPDVLGREWALTQLAARLNAKATADAEKTLIVRALASSVIDDKFWGLRAEAAGALKGTAGDPARKNLLSAAHDPNPKVRAAALTSLGDSREAALTDVYLRALNDQSYAVVGAAAAALGATKTPAAYDALIKLLAAPSWRDQLRAAALDGLTATGDKRAIELGLRYAAPGSATPVRKAAVYLLGAVGKNDPRALPLLLRTLQQSLADTDIPLAYAAGESIFDLDDLEGLKSLRALLTVATKFVPDPDLQNFLAQVEHRLAEKQVAK